MAPLKTEDSPMFHGTLPLLGPAQEEGFGGNASLRDRPRDSPVPEATSSSCLVMLALWHTDVILLLGERLEVAVD